MDIDTHYALYESWLRRHRPHDTNALQEIHQLRESERQSSEDAQGYLLASAIAVVILVLTVALFLTVTKAHAQFSTFSDDSGTTGTLYNFNNGFNSYQDSRGNTGTIYNYGNGFRGYQFNGPNGTNTGTIYTFPTQPFLNPPSLPLPLAPPFPAPLYPFGQTTQQPQGLYRIP